MGWTTLYRRPGMTDREFFEREFPTTLTQHGRILACATIKGAFYAAVQNNEHAGHPNRTWAMVVLIQRTRGEYNFGYKEMDEGMGPVVDDCPDRILDLLTEPAPNEYAQDWRERCRKNNATARRLKEKKIQAGETVRFTTPENLAQLGPLTRVDSRKGIFRTENGGRYHISWWRRAEWETV